MSKADKLNLPVLILNVNFEPLHVCNTKRAIALVMSGKAEIIVNGRGYIRTSSHQFEVPSVIKLGHMIKRPRLAVNLTKREVLRRDDYTCQYCGKKTSLLTIDHVMPRRLGGQHLWTNVVAACPPCNRRKGGRTPEGANMQLRQEPYEPSPSAYYRFGRHLNTHQEWEQFIQGW